ncbi:stage II sporulation protein D [Paenibacillus sp. YYML68]|uniref:stage II sporulation protein D n=1 Tax=Paenibacillus sp. YYML68 TaxID=2909250 RepID=UPI00248FE833|nr:stage II sporulation protein D [Paenibacillus sp. YYML68]
MARYKLSGAQHRGLRWGGCCLLGFLVVIIVVPLTLVRTSPEDRSAAIVQADATVSQRASVQIPVHRSGSQVIERIELEQYVLGVVAGEMPIEFELEALKAQALAARTYIVRKLAIGGGTGQDAQVASGAVVSDTTAHQVYVSPEELRNRWGSDKYETYMAKLRKAVEGTRDQVITYKGEPIDASYFSTSNGYTENSEDYWNVEVPYLRSVASPWDAKLSPRYKETVSFTAKELQQKLALPAAVPALAGSKQGLRIIELSEGNRIKRLTAGGKTFTGREFRERLGLNSSQFQWSYEKGKWTFTTFGYGHGVGMSQWGANGMAREGKTADDIIRHYYTGVEYGSAATFLQGKSF